MREVNEPLCDMLSLRRADLLDMPVSKLALDAAAISALADIDDTRPVTCRLRGRNGGGLTVQVRICATAKQDPPCRSMQKQRERAVFAPSGDRCCCPPQNLSSIP